MTEKPASVDPATDHRVVESARKSLFSFSIALDVLLGVMLVLGLLISAGNNGLRDMHSIVGYMALLVGLICAFVALRVAMPLKRMGVFFHALSLPILMAVQIALGEIGQTHIHMALGVAIVLAAVGLTMLAKKLAARTTGTTVTAEAGATDHR